MFHEHNRDDRDRFVEVDLEAIKQYETQNRWPEGYFSRHYKKCAHRGCRSYHHYDYDSLMHYGPYLEGTNITIMKSKLLCNKKPCPIGQREKLSFIDKKDISAIYGCSKCTYIF